MPTKPSRSKKFAMVAPPPAKVKPAKPAEPDRLEDILAGLGNDRPYFIISHQLNSWIVFFQGDDKPKSVILIGGKWLIK
jgi:hypothetical protein